MSSTAAKYCGSSLLRFPIVLQSRKGNADRESTAAQSGCISWTFRSKCSERNLHTIVEPFIKVLHARLYTGSSILHQLLLNLLVSSRQTSCHLQVGIVRHLVHSCSQGANHLVAF